MDPEHIIERLGGSGSVARELRAMGFTLTDKAVEQWIKRSSIPGGWHLHLLGIARKQEVPLAAEELLSATSRRCAS